MFMDCVKYFCLDVSGSMGTDDVRRALSVMADRAKPTDFVVLFDCEVLGVWPVGDASDVTRNLMRAYEAQCTEDEQSEPETLDHDKAYEFMANLYVQRRVRQGRDPVTAAEEFEWPEALPRDFPLRKGILRCVAIRMTNADNWMYKKMREEYLREHPETSSPTV
jgi:hypothetical protein